ncbi:MAG: phosphate signaling complex protein PhoU [Chloroflexi bacterium]|nr:phosphate signaling complex protein PhoU [Chloroflexota bacterium]GIW09976.1 MAG: phosphate transport system regulatory protein PhoU [Dehalococcoidia bacterium]
MAGIRTHFEQQLQELQDETLILGSMVDAAIAAAVDALKRRDLKESERVIAEDTLIDRKRWEIEQRSILVIATQQPTAGDLRVIYAIVNIITDLERMADHAEGIAKISLMIGQSPLPKPLIDIPRMSDHARSMLRRALDAFVNRDAETAKAIALEDDLIDALYDQVYRELLTIMIQDPKQITIATYLLWVAHNLERIADRVTNICERVVYTVTGRMEEINVSKY